MSATTKPTFALPVSCRSSAQVASALSGVARDDLDGRAHAGERARRLAPEARGRARHHHHAVGEAAALERRPVVEPPAERRADAGEAAEDAPLERRVDARRRRSSSGPLARASRSPAAARSPMRRKATRRSRSNSPSGPIEGQRRVVGDDGAAPAASTLTSSTEVRNAVRATSRMRRGGSYSLTS